MRARNRLREPLIDLDEVAGRLGVSPRYVRRLVAERRIAYLKVGRLLRFDADVVDAWLAACAVRTYEGGAPSPTARPVKRVQRPASHAISTPLCPTALSMAPAPPLDGR